MMVQGGRQQMTTKSASTTTFSFQWILRKLFQSNYGLLVGNLFLGGMMWFLLRGNSDGTDYSIIGDGNEAGASTPVSMVRSSSVEDIHNKKINDGEEPCSPVVTEDTQSLPQLNDEEIGRTATVMAIATGYELLSYQRFVGSLRNTGYQGNIILAVSPTIEKEIEDYLLSKNVIIKNVEYTPCTHPVKPELFQHNNDTDKQQQKGDIQLEDIEDTQDRELVTCLKEYPQLKHRWARFPLLRDHLLECGGHSHPEIQCGGPVLVTDLADTIFQRNPFGVEAPKVEGLQVFEEFHTIRTTNWLTDWPIGDCKGVHYDEPMLCSGTTIGTRNAILDYLTIMEEEMNVWMQSTVCCCFQTNGDDQSIHNYIYYNQQLDTVRGGVQAIPNRVGLVHTVGAQGSLIFNTHMKTRTDYWKSMDETKMKNQKNTTMTPEEMEKYTNDKKWTYHDQAFVDPYELSESEPGRDSGDDSGGIRKNWLGFHYGLTDDEGYFLNVDGISRSYVIHQYDRFGPNYNNWIYANRVQLYL